MAIASCDLDDGSLEGGGVASFGLGIGKQLDFQCDEEDL